jgi:hypothetical protein
VTVASRHCWNPPPRIPYANSTPLQELELLQYHKSNAALDLMIGELKLKRVGMARDLDGVQEAVDDQDETLLKVRGYPAPALPSLARLHPG